MENNPSKINLAQTVFDIDIGLYRHPEHEIERLFVERWSPRAMTGEQITDEELSRMFEAARWAPSSYNNQPARFLYAKRGTAAWKTLFDLMTEPNQLWAGKAAVLMMIISKKTFDFNGQPSVTHSYDSGAAWACLALEGARMGLVVHGMQGFNYAKAKTVLNVPDDYQVEAMAAIGRPASKDTLPVPLQEREFPSGRKHINQIAYEVGSDADFHNFLAISAREK